MASSIRPWRRLVCRRVAGDPALAALGDNALPEQLAAFRKQFGLNMPLWRQYLDFLAGVLTFDLGRSLLHNQPVVTLLAHALPYNPDPDAPRRQIVLSGDVPSPSNAPSGCAFHSRCPTAVARCRSEQPALQAVASDHAAACHFAAPNPIRAI